jgi:peptidoglycan/LPS O-acetylase OafA/YrhL
MSMGEHRDHKRSNRAFLPRIESLRGIAALTVAVSHATTPFFSQPAQGHFDQVGLLALKALGNGYGAVVAFFVMSGFVLARSLDRSSSVRGFAIARAFRLLPAVASTIGVFVLVYAFFGYVLNGRASYGPLNLILNMLLLRVNIDVVMWSMKAELAATPLIFVCSWIGRSGRAQWMLLIAGGLFALSFFGQYCHALGNDTNLAPAFAFPVGVWLHFKGSKLVLRLSTGSAALVACAAVIVFCGCSFFNTVASVGLLAECLSAATLIALIAFRETDAIFAPLDHPVLRFYGQISYSLYLLHPLSLWSAAQVADHLERFTGLPMSVVALGAGLFCVAATTPLAYLSWRFVETPFVRLGRSVRREDRSTQSISTCSHRASTPRALITDDSA